jgi:GT2 family glycosyltransferase
MLSPLVNGTPVLIRYLHPLRTASCRDSAADVGYTVINFNTALQTLRCITSLTQCSDPPLWITVLDNASSQQDFDALQAGLQAANFSHIQLFRSETNLGFAAGSNFLVDQLLADTNCYYIGLLNNDAVAMPALIGLLTNALQSSPIPVGLAGGRMHKLSEPQLVDTLGISVYASLMPADRHNVEDPFLGPTGGCCMMTRDFIQDIIGSTGYFFDPRYFCYCEDTDLVLRAALLGYKAVYVDELVALHEGQASSSTQSDDFIAYHGLRNAIWMHCKFMPTRVLIKHVGWLFLAHTMTIVRQTLSGRAAVMYRVYRDAFRQWPSMLKERTNFKKLVRVAPSELYNVIAPRFYRKGYAALVLRGWMQRVKPTGNAP